jgi:hypothetical protein
MEIELVLILGIELDHVLVWEAKKFIGLSKTHINWACARNCVLSLLIFHQWNSQKVIEHFEHQKSVSIYNTLAEIERKKVRFFLPLCYKYLLMGST